MSNAPAPVHQLVGHFSEELAAQFASRAQNAIKPTGWKYTEIFFNALSGYVKINLLMRASPRHARTINIRRSIYGQHCLFQREIVEVKHSFALGEWLDTCDSTLIGRVSMPNIRSTLRACAAYLIDNPAPGRTAIGAMDSMQVLNEIIFQCLPNAKDQPGRPSDAGKAPQRLEFVKRSLFLWGIQRQDHRAGRNPMNDTDGGL